MHALRPQLLSWSATVFSFRRNGCHYCVDVCRVIFDVLYGEFVQMFWAAANPANVKNGGGGRRSTKWFPGMLLGAVGVVNAQVSRMKSFGPNGLRFIISFVAKKKKDL